MKSIERNSLRTVICAQLRTDLIDGTLPPGSSINEIKMAKTLEVSRVPVREALIHMESVGIVSSRPGKGFHVPFFSPQEVREVYETVATINSICVLKSNENLQSIANSLSKYNTKIANVSSKSSPMGFLELDRQWHVISASGYGNSCLRAILNINIDRVWRYEYAYWDRLNRNAISIAQHNQIEELFRSGDTKRAAQAIEHHWLEPLSALIDQLQEDLHEKRKS